MAKYKKGDVVKARITAIEKYGAFAALDDEYSGLIHISELTNRFVKNITDFVEIGDIINVKVLDASKNKNQLKLSAKEVNKDLYKNKKSCIKETIFGFYLLKSALPNWVREKIEEINKKNWNSLDIILKYWYIYIRSNA